MRTRPLAIADIESVGHSNMYLLGVSNTGVSLSGGEETLELVLHSALLSDPQVRVEPVRDGVSDTRGG